MKMSRKWILVAALVLSVAMASSGTIAYLQDSDSDVNVMTMGSVHIKQHEYERVVEDGKYKTADIDEQTSYVLKDFTQGKPIVPSAVVTNEAGWDWDPITVRMSQVDSYGGMQTFLKSSNAQDKFVTVENTGKSPAFVRTLVAIEIGDASADLIGSSYHQTWTKKDIGPIEIDGNTYQLFEYLYNGADGVRHENGILPAGDTTYPNLSQVYLHAKATNEDLEAIDGNGNGMLDILVLSQAVQADGFADAKTALDTAFGEVNEANIVKWFDGNSPILTVSTAAELQAELDKATDGTTIFLANDITGDVTVTQKDNVKVTIDGMGNTFNGSILVDGKSARYETAGVTIKNIKFDASAISADAFINLGNGTTNTRYTNHVTVSGCTFNYTGEGDKVAIKSYTGGDKNLTVTGCTVNSNMHSLLQVTNVEEGLTITNCKVYSKNGINLNNTPSLEMSGCEFDTKGYCVRVGVNGSTLNGIFNISDSTLKSAGDDGDAVIIVRGNAAGSTLNLTGVTLDGTPDIANPFNAVVNK